MSTVQVKNGNSQQNYVKKPMVGGSGGGGAVMPIKNLEQRSVVDKNFGSVPKFNKKPEDDKYAFFLM